MSQNHLLKNTSFPQWTAMRLLQFTEVPYRYGSICGLSVWPINLLFIPASQPCYLLWFCNRLWGLIGHAQLIRVLFQNCFGYVCIFSIPWILHSICQLLWRVLGVLIGTALPLCINLRKSNIFVIMCLLSMTTISHHLLVSYFVSFNNIS